MRLIDASTKILKWHQPLFRTSDAAGLLNVQNAHASKILERLSKAEQVVRLSRAVWCIPERVDKLSVPEHLTAPWPSYISLQTALFYHGMISQIPQVIYAISLARTKTYETPLGTYSVHHVNPLFFFGFESLGVGGIKMAEPEKALIDLLYLSPARSRLFKTLPEVEWPPNFSLKKAGGMIDQIAAPKRRQRVRHLFEGLCNR